MFSKRLNEGKDPVISRVFGLGCLTRIVINYTAFHIKLPFLELDYTVPFIIALR
jgi:hypothetical protein